MLFRKEYAFLSNMYETPVLYEGILYPSSENAYQAARTLDISLRQKFAKLTPPEAKRMAKMVPSRPDWHAVNLNVMYEIVKAKFSQNAYLAKRLLSTGDIELVESNYWHDTFWGVCNGVGENHLGKILMQVREELRAA